jgi:hypothetical protein
MSHELIQIRATSYMSHEIIQIFKEKQQNEQQLTQKIIEELTAWFPLQRTLPAHT